MQVRPRQEKFVSAALDAKGYEQFLPLYMSRRAWSDRTKEVQLPLLDGYVFCRLNPASRLPILTIPGVNHFVGFGKTPASIPDDEIEALRAIVHAGVPSHPWPFLKVGQRVHVIQGPLRNLEGILVQIKGIDRLVISVNLLQRSVAVQIDRNWVSPVSSNTSWVTGSAVLPRYVNST